jgi:hypothetical protein
MAVSLKPIAAVDVADRQREKDNPNRQHKDVHHGSAPSIASKMRDMRRTFTRDYVSSFA